MVLINAHDGAVIIVIISHLKFAETIPNSMSSVNDGFLHVRWYSIAATLRNPAQASTCDICKASSQVTSPHETFHPSGRMRMARRR